MNARKVVEMKFIELYGSVEFDMDGRKSVSYLTLTEAWGLVDKVGRLEPEGDDFCISIDPDKAAWEDTRNAGPIEELSVGMVSIGRLRNIDIGEIVYFKDDSGSPDLWWATKRLS